jgi:pyroglutamyl-peptidase
MVLAIGGCSAPSSNHEPGRSLSDAERDGLLRSWGDGKYDSAGHPFGARVFEAETACSPRTGEAQAEGWGADPDDHEGGLLCTLDIPDVSPGQRTLNLRLLTQETGEYTCPDGAGADECPTPPEVLTLRVLDASGSELGKKTVRHDEFRKPMTYQNLWVSFSRWQQSAIKVELTWSGLAPVRIDYLELFRSMRRAVLSPASGVLAGGERLEAQLIGSPLPTTVELSCNGTDLADVVAQLTSDGKLSTDQTEFRTVLQGALAPVLEQCSWPARLLARGRFGASYEAARTTYRQQPVACTFEPNKLRVLLTGFEPFPATSTRDNSSEQAVKGFDEKKLGPHISAMRVILPVEWDVAAAMVVDLVDRCKPDVVVGFGQGRSSVQPETTAHNAKSSSAFSGGTPDNRGILADGPVVAGGPAKLETSLPAQAIVDALAAAGINAGTSGDAGRYICNNLFYAIMHRVQSGPIRGGFVHLPVISQVGEEDRQRLQTVVETVVRETLALDVTRLFEADFEDGSTQGWGIIGSGDGVGWTLVGQGGAGDSKALRYFDPTFNDYGQQGGHGATKGTATTGYISLPAGKRALLSFDLYMDTEAGKQYDTLAVEVGGKEVWRKDGPGSAVAQKTWQRVLVDLTSLAGQTVQVGFTFDTVDGHENLGQGVWIDNVVVSAR